MNELIEKLAREAGVINDLSFPRPGTESLEAFARLVAKECAGLLDAEQKQVGILHNYPGFYARMIRARFGIEGE